MSKFKGFPESTPHLTPLPEAFFSELLPQIDHWGELQVTLLAFWLLDRMEGVFRFLRWSDFSNAGNLAEELKESEQLEEALKRAVARGSLLQTDMPQPSGVERCYFLNSPKGRAALRAIQSGQWRPGSPAPEGIPVETVNIYRLYEENIGPLTPLLADALKEAEETYPADWIEEAVRIAVTNNKRNWRYVTAILERWNREGRDAKKTKTQDRRDPAQARSRYVEGEFSDFIEH